MYQSPRYPDVERTRFQEIREQRREFAVEHDETTSKPPSGRVNRAHRGLHFPCSRAVELALLLSPERSCRYEGERFIFYKWQLCVRIR